MISDLHIETVGQGEPLVMLHGWGWHSAIWQPLIPYLAQYYQLFLVDLPGFGRSPLSINDYSFETISTLVLQKVPDQATWLGWSLGGMLTWWIAAHYPDKMKQFITVAASPRFMQDHDWPGVATTTLDQFAEALLQDHEKTILHFLQLQWHGSPQDLTLLHTLQQQIVNPAPQAAALCGGLTLLRHADLRQTMQTISVPSLHLFGRKDRLVPATVSMLIPSLTTNSQCHVFQRSGHMPFLSEQELFLELLNRFTGVL